MAKRKFRINFPQSLRCKIASAAIRRHKRQGNDILIGWLSEPDGLRGNKIAMETFAAETSYRAQCFNQLCARYIL